MPAALAIPLITAAIGAGGSLGSALISKHKSGGSSSSLLPPGLDTTALKDTIGQQKDLASYLTGEGKSTLTQGKGTLQQPLDFYSRILGGDRQQIMENLAPEVAAINAQFGAPMKETAITGRGSALAPDQESSRQSAISNLFFKERPAAADKLTGIAQGLMSLGAGEINSGGGFLSDASHEILDYNSIIRGIQAQGSRDSASTFGALGQSLGPILKAVLAGKGGGDGSGAPPTGNPTDWGGIFGSMPSSSFSGGDPALTSSLLNLNSGTPDFYSSWLHEGGHGGG